MYRLEKNEKKLIKLEEKLFIDLNIRERVDIEEWVEKNPEVLGEELLIIAKEYAGFDKTNERLDLLALDKKGNTVVIELKRDDSGKGLDWQAVKYASYCSQLLEQDIIDIFSEYSRKDRETARKEIINFLEEETVLNEDQRIILVSKEFRVEVTSSVLWLIDKGINIKCVTVKPFHDKNDDKVYINFNVILPPPELEQYLVKRGKVEKEQTDKREEIKSYTVDKHLSNGTKKTIEIFNSLSGRIKSLGTNIKETVTTYYIGYKSNRNFVEIYIQKENVKVLILPVPDLIDKDKICKVVPESYRWVLNTQFYISSINEIDRAMELISQSYQYQANAN